MRVLLVEDDLTSAHGISLMLKQVGVVVEQAETGEEAVELARHYEYDIVLLDVILPDIEDYEVIRRMRAARNDTPMLIVSGLSLPVPRVKGFGAGADDSPKRLTGRSWRDLQSKSIRLFKSSQVVSWPLRWKQCRSGHRRIVDWIGAPCTDLPMISGPRI